MKIRKLLLSAKLEQIEKENENIFIFHCTANATQWRLLKNFLFFASHLTARNESSGTKKTSELRTLEGAQHRLVSSIDPARLLRRPENDSTDTHGKQDFSLSWLRGYTFFQSTSFKKKLSHTACRKDLRSLSRSRLSAREASPNVAKVCCEVPSSERSTRKAVLRQARSTNRLASQKSLNKKFKPKGCLFFFDTRSNTIFETQQKNTFCLELVKKMETLEFNNNLILLYGQVKSTVVNHVDLKETLILDAQTTYQQLFFVLRTCCIGLHFCLQQKQKQVR